MTPNNKELDNLVLLLTENTSWSSDIIHLLVEGVENNILEVFSIEELIELFEKAFNIKRDIKGDSIITLSKYKRNILDHRLKSLDDQYNNIGEKRKEFMKEIRDIDNLISVRLNNLILINKKD